MRRLNLMAYVAVVGCLLFTGSCLHPELTDPSEQFVKDMAAIENYLTTNGLSAYQDVSGMRFSITTLGTGGLPARYDQEVTVQYKGRLLDGTVFDEGTTTGPLSNYIRGWRRGITFFPKGTAATLYIPSEFGYGSEERPKIPPYSVLIFDVVIEEVFLTAAEKVRRPADEAAIDAYLADNSITAVTDTTGVRYVITEQGTGEIPGWYSKVRFNYTGKLLNGTKFYEGTAEPTFDSNSRLVDFIHGVGISLSKLQVGGKGTFYIPSDLAFGANASGSAPVPPHANVIYEAELVAIIPE